MRVSKLFYAVLATVGLQGLGLSASQLNTKKQRQAQKKHVENLINAKKWQEAASGIAVFEPKYPRFAIDLRDFFVKIHTPEVGSLTYDKTLLNTPRGRQQIKDMILKKLEGGDFESARAGIAALPEQFKRDLHKSFITAAVAKATKAPTEPVPVPPAPEPEPVPVPPAPEPEPVPVPPAPKPDPERPDPEKAKAFLEEQRLREAAAAARKKYIERLKLAAEQERQKAKGNLQLRLNNVALEFKDDPLMLSVATALRDLRNEEVLSLEFAHALLDIFNHVDKSGSWSLVNYGFKSPTQIHGGKLYVTQDNAFVDPRVDYDKAIDITGLFETLVDNSAGITPEEIQALYMKLLGAHGAVEKDLKSAVSSMMRFVGSSKKEDGEQQPQLLLENIKKFKKVKKASAPGGMASVFEEIEKLRKKADVGE